MGKANAGHIFAGPDLLRQAVEGASSGQATVMYNDKGYPSYMCRIPAFNIEGIDPALGSGLHPMFIVGGVAKSEIWVGQFQAIVHDGRALSLPGREPKISISWDAANAACAANGPGWHMMTNAEWAAISLLSHHLYGADAVHGNTYYGQDHANKLETGTRQDGATYPPGNTGGAARTLTGSGPSSWRHNGDHGGIADLVGNVWEWQRGMRLVDGEIQIIPDNDAADQSVSHAVDSVAWKAILEDGTLVAPGTAGTLKMDASNPDGSGNVILSTSVTGQSDGATSASTQYNALTAAATVPEIVKLLGLYPHATGMQRGRLYMRNLGERMPLRGGIWSNASYAGLFALYLSYGRSHADSYIGFRPAFVL